MGPEEFFKELDKSFPKIDMQNCLVIACQHILETTLYLFKHMLARGLKPGNTYLLGKCYSTSPEVMSKFKKLGIKVNKNSLEFDSYRSFDGQFDFMVQEFLKKIEGEVDLSSFSKVILIDDGGYLVYWANKILNKQKNIVAIEQTSSGYTKLKNEELNFPVINVARSNAKLSRESPFIAQIFLDKLEKNLKNLKLKPKNVLIFGGGPVGKEIYKLCEKRYSVKIYDSNPSLSHIDQSKFKEFLEGADMIIGATGREVIGMDSYSSLKKNCVLASASSSDREFQAVNLRKLVPKTKDSHKNFLIRGLHLINAGFPVNFTGEKESLGWDKIKITRGLIYIAICCAMSKNYRNGFVELDKDLQERVADLSS